MYGMTNDRIEYSENKNTDFQNLCDQDSSFSDMENEEY